jgi:4-diphosphocytidyl-2-C-methyl-D-erythritol kinase
MSELTVLATAKLNLTLEVLGKRPDGYHEIRSVFQTINLGDGFRFKTARRISYKCDMPGWSAESSLVARAVSLMREAAGYSGGAAIEIEKRIPLMSGLGGDSSGAAAVLRGLNELWGLGLPPEKLTEIAVSLGSDVAFFLHRGTALAEGRGEIVTPLPPLSGIWAVLVVPDVPIRPGKTAEMYASLKPAHFTDGHITHRLTEVLTSRRALHHSMLFNTFENVAFSRSSELSVYREHLLKLGAPRVHLAGSGPAMFVLMGDKAQAADLLVRCQNQRMKGYVVRMATGHDKP